MFRTNFDTFLTSHAFFLVHKGDTVANVDRVEFTDADTSSAAETTGGATFGTVSVIAD